MIRLVMTAIVELAGGTMTSCTVEYVNRTEKIHAQWIPASFTQ